MTMPEQTSLPGKTTIALDVLLTIANLTTLNIPGVSRLSSLPKSGMTGMLRRGQTCEGVCIDVEDNIVYADLFVILKNDVNIRDVSRTIQREVARAISDMVGMQVGRINVHIDDIDYAVEA
jgi:uncharacterized alkaline shock family protein YloU